MHRSPPPGRLPTPPPLSPFSRGAAALPLLIGHRGTRVHAPENTLRAFEWAADAGADGIELDVRRCGSGELLVVHDTDLGRVAGTPLAVAEASAAQVCGVDLGMGQRVPLLSEVLHAMRSRHLLVHIEVKADGQPVPALCEAVVAFLSELPVDVAVGCCVSSFSRRVLSAVHRGCPHITCAALLPEGTTLPCGDVRDDVRGLHPHRALVNPAFVAAARAGGRFVNAWTVDDPDLARQLAQDGVDGLISDDVAALREAM